MSYKPYKKFIDGLVELSDSVEARRVLTGWRHPEPSPERRKVEDFLSALDDDQRQILASLLQEERTGGIHDALAFLESEEYTISDDKGRAFKGSPFSELHFDYAARLEGDPWPE